jgi:hypothetical protein
MVLFCSIQFSEFIYVKIRIFLIKNNCNHHKRLPTTNLDNTRTSDNFKNTDFTGKK